MKNKGIELIWITVSDLKKSVKYYSDVVGLKVAEVNEAFGWAEMESEGGARLGLAQANPEFDMRAGSNAVIAITVEDLDVAKDDLQVKGATLCGDVLEVPNICKMQLCADADGNRFQLVQHLDN